MGDITLQPETKTWMPRVNRDHPMTARLHSAIGWWHAKRMRGKAATKPHIEIVRDHSARRNKFLVYWLEADLPLGHEGERIIVPDEGSELEWELHTP